MLQVMGVIMSMFAVVSSTRPPLRQCVGEVVRVVFDPGDAVVIRESEPPEPTVGEANGAHCVPDPRDVLRVLVVPRLRRGGGPCLELHRTRKLELDHRRSDPEPFGDPRSALDALYTPTEVRTEG